MDKQKLIVDYAISVNTLIALINILPADKYDYIPKNEYSWTIQQHIKYLVDCETNNSIRIK